MSTSKMIPVNPNLNLNQVLAVATENLQAQGYEVVATPMSATSASMTVRKDRDGFKNFMGLGVESRVQMMVNNTAMTLSIEHEWTNKIIALIVGWFLCWVPIVTGIMGCVNQSGLTNKINDAVMLGCNSSPNGVQANPQYGYQQPQYQAPQYQAPQYQAPQQQYQVPQQPQYQAPQDVQPPYQGDTQNQ